MNGIAGIEPDKLTENLQPLFQEILKLPKAQVDANHPLQMLIANVDYDDFKGKMGIGRILNGEINAGDSIAYGKPGEPVKTSKIAELYVFNNVGREKVEKASAGEHLSIYLSHEFVYFFYITCIIPCAHHFLDRFLYFIINNLTMMMFISFIVGDIVMITGISDVSIGDTVMSKETPIPLPPITVEVR